MQSNYCVDCCSRVIFCLWMTVCFEKGLLQDAPGNAVLEAEILKLGDINCSGPFKINVLISGILDKELMFELVLVLCDCRELLRSTNGRFKGVLEHIRIDVVLSALSFSYWGHSRALARTDFPLRRYIVGLVGCHQRYLLNRKDCVWKLILLKWAGCFWA